MGGTRGFNPFSGLGWVENSGLGWVSWNIPVKFCTGWFDFGLSFQLISRPFSDVSNGDMLYFFVLFLSLRLRLAIAVWLYRKERLQIQHFGG
jgi:hypothetical protein